LRRHVPAFHLYMINPIRLVTLIAHRGATVESFGPDWPGGVDLVPD
jgi:hypothetical protein